VDLSKPVQLEGPGDRGMHRVFVGLFLFLAALFVARVVHMQFERHRVSDLLISQGNAAYAHLVKLLQAKDAAGLADATTEEMQQSVTAETWESHLERLPALSGEWKSMGFTFKKSGSGGFWKRFVGMAADGATMTYRAKPRGANAPELRIEFVGENGAAKVKNLWLGEEHVAGPG
jgi:hypothetical protein